MFFAKRFQTLTYHYSTAFVHLFWFCINCIKVVNKANKIVDVIKRNVVPGNIEVSFLVRTRPWLSPFWDMLCLPGRPIYRNTLTHLNESNAVGPRNTLSRCHLNTLRTKKVFNQGGLIYLCKSSTMLFMFSMA